MVPLEYESQQTHNPAQARDLLKKLYHELFPRKLRHDLGEYYTPDWLAEVVLDRVHYDGDPRKRLLDPACGSGTFLVLAMGRIQTWVRKNVERAPRPDRLASLVARNLIGFDLNPLAVLAARTNFLIQFFDLLDYRGTLEIPIYLCDSVLTPFEYGSEDQPGFAEQPVAVPTAARLFYVPREVTHARDVLASYCNLLAEYARSGSGFSVEDFVDRCLKEGLPVSQSVEDQHKQLFREIRTLDEERRNGIWARFIKNVFAPVFLRGERVDYVVGNPPWVNWESLPGRIDAPTEQNYRQRAREVFKRYGLFSLGGTEARLGGGKKDLSMPFVYAAVDHYLKEGGELGYVITQTVFKTTGAGDGFRRFRFGAKDQDDEKQVFIVPREVDDLSSFQPFEGATNRTALVTFTRSKRAVKYPVRYRVWRKTKRGRIQADWSRNTVEERVETLDFAAVPVERGKPTSPWLTAPRAVLGPLRRIIGPSDYRGRAGCCSWLNGVYWVRKLRKAPGGWLVENLTEAGRTEIKRKRSTIEPDLVYPLLRGRDAKRWRAGPSASIVLTNVPETRAGVPLAKMKRDYPQTFSYLKSFEKKLRDRSGFKKYLQRTEPFYAVYNVGSYTVAEWKVVWREQSSTFQAVVVGPTPEGEVVIPDHKLMLVECEQGEREANYLAALLNSTPAKLLVGSYVISTSTSTHVLENLRISRFDKKSELHKRLANLGTRAHKAAASGKPALLKRIEAEIDQAAAALWKISPAELELCYEGYAQVAAIVEDDSEPEILVE